ncbi:taste receptor type 2 member 41-like [Hemicordylus capensis]|uniref:taste receptor type 2 member 41-like n=1 Tax=Hemicordylus capensis TaxID=884348 RepID=UPI002302A164|nr:taste receptor type 2 member 41-like [Hemicordylus capensis]
MDRGRTTPLGIFTLSVLGILSIAALLGNGFIIVVIGHRWLQSRKMVPCDLLLTSLSTSRFLLQLIVMMSQFLYFCSPEIYTHVQEVIDYVWMFFNIVSFWCTSWLSVFYCVKVANFIHALFLWLKLRINMLVPRLLGMSLIPFVVFSVSIVVSCFGKKKHYSLSGNLPGNTSQSEACDYSLTIVQRLQIAFSAINVSICLTASILLLVSLWRHTRHLKKNGIGIKDFNTQAHFNVIMSLLLFLFFYILYFVAVMLPMTKYFKFGNLERLVSDTALSLLPSAHSIILILTNPKLKEVCTRVLNIRRRSS